jgi:pimeloyl-ACP methyl ester carboxylesterase
VVEAFEASVSKNVSDFAADIAIPTLLIAAELDDITPVQAHYDVIEHMPDAKLNLLMGVGHLIHYEVPDLAAQAIEEFLENRGFTHRPIEEPRTT